jgi:signal peptidase I
MTAIAQRGPRASRGPRWLFGWFVTIVAMVAWFGAFAPTSVGGPTSYVFVVGESMQPLLWTGDLAIARSTGDHQVGDIVYFTTDRGPVIHRIVDGDAADGWITQGDNVPFVDDWVVPDAAIAGEYWFSVPNVTPAFLWVRENPLLFGLAAAGLAALSYLPWRRRRLPETLKVALAFGTKEPRRHGRTALEYSVAGLSYVATIGALALVAATYASKTTAWTTWGLALASLALALSASLYFLYRLSDGFTVAEPNKSLYALSGRLHLVEAFPDSLDAREVRSAVALRTLAEKYRLPVLHRVDPVTGRHAFLLITAQEGSFTWSPPSRRMVQEHPPATPPTGPGSSQSPLGPTAPAWSGRGSLVGAGTGGAQPFPRAAPFSVFRRLRTRTSDVS